MTRFILAAAVILALAGGPAKPAPAETGGWMLPAAKSEDLVYIATGDNVYVLSYPAGKLSGALNVPGDNICSDKQGDVFVPQTATDRILEYAHGASMPTQTLGDGDQPLGCAVDAMTGNLAVTNEGSGAGEVAIYANAQGTAQWYRDPEIGFYGLCGYDNAGNLFMDGTGSTNVFAELPKGSSTFANATLDERFDAFGSVQWDGTSMTLTNPSTETIYRVQLEKAGLHVTGATRARGWQNAYSGHWPYVQTWLQRDTFLAQSNTTADVGLWPYPAGGSPRKSIGGFKSGGANVYGIAISVARRG
jgi:hypothetical protein